MFTNITVLVPHSPNVSDSQVWGSLSNTHCPYNVGDRSAQYTVASWDSIKTPKIEENTRRQMRTPRTGWCWEHKQTKYRWRTSTWRNVYTTHEERQTKSETYVRTSIRGPLKSNVPSSSDPNRIVRATSVDLLLHGEKLSRLCVWQLTLPLYLLAQSSTKDFH